jgi:hypothetical protein
MIYMKFHTRCTNMPMSFNGTEHMHIVMAKVDVIFYMALNLMCLDTGIFRRFGNARISA